MKETMEKGITLIALVITIIIMLILAGVTLSLSLGDGGLIQKTREAVAQYEGVQEQEAEDIKNMEDLLKEVNHETFNNKGVNKPVLTDGMIPIKYKNGKWVITNQYDEEWYEYKDVSKLAWANVMLSDGKYKWSERNNKEANGYYTDDGTTVVNDEDLGSMFVWIPRFAYSINSYHTKSNTDEGKTQNLFDVTFINGTGSKDFDGNTYATTYNLDGMKVGEETPKIVHPAFDNAKGIWIAKFEASMEGTTTTTTKENDNVIKNKLRVLPNAETWRYISIGNSFLNCFNMQKSENVYGLADSKVDSHLIKNSEWGAVAYLAASQYGFVPTINNKYERESSTDVYHEWAGGQAYETNTKQSTTGNVTGVYDMCGGAWEYVAAYYDNKNGNITKYGTTDVFNSDNKTVKDEYKKYWEVYSVGEEEKTKYVDINALWNLDNTHNTERMKITKERYELMKEHLGDAMYEVIGTDYSYYGKTTAETYAWMTEVSGSSKLGTGFYNNDYALIGNCAQPFVYRGGNWIYGAGTGVFALSDDGGGPNWNRAFRPVLVV